MSLGSTGPGAGGAAVVPLVLIAILLAPTPSVAHLSGTRSVATPSPGNASAVANFSAALQRLVTLVGVSGSAVLAIAWARVAVSWFSNDLGKKIQAKDRARDALIGTLLFVAAVSGLAWGLARWVLTGG